MPFDAKNARIYAGRMWEGRRKTIEERFWAKVEKTPSCWNWTGSRNKKGYGRFGLSHTKHGEPAIVLTAPRVAWTLTNGLIPDGQCVLHKCDNPACVNPEHLWLGTRLDNNRDTIAKGRQGRPSAKLTIEQVQEIRKRYAQGENQTSLGRQFGVTNITVHMIVHRKRWKDVV
jgi:hypothetical protein